MKRTRSIAMLAALALAATLTACSGDADTADTAESAPPPDAASATQSEQQAQSPTPADDAVPEAERQIVAYRLELDHYREMVGAFDMRVVEAVMDDGTVVACGEGLERPCDRPEDRVLLVAFEGVEVPETGTCGAQTASEGVMATADQMFGQPVASWAPNEGSTDVEPATAYVFETAYPAGIDNPDLGYKSTADLVVDGASFSEALVAQRFARDAGLETPSYADQEAGACAAGLGIWAECQD